MDGGNPALTSTASLLISIIDVNDNPPMFTRPQYTREVREDQPVINRTLLVVTANDNDSSEVNGGITYSITAGVLTVYMFI